MATQQARALGRILVAPSVALLFLWMIVPLVMTIYFSTLRYQLLNPGTERFIGAQNYIYFLTDPAFIKSLSNTLVLVGSVLAITVGITKKGAITMRRTIERPTKAWSRRTS